MIKLLDLIKESDEGYKPYMYSAVGFGCHVCKWYYKEDGKHMCDNSDYVDYMGTKELVKGKGSKEQIDDPAKWCSNWFQPKAQ